MPDGLLNTEKLMLEEKRPPLFWNDLLWVYVITSQWISIMDLFGNFTQDKWIDKMAKS